MLQILMLTITLLQLPSEAERIDAAIAGAAREQGIDPRVLRALLEVESGLNPRARSRHGIGIASFTPAGIRGVNALRARAGRADRFSAVLAMRPGPAIRAAAELLAAFRRTCGGGIEAALAGYNGGYAHCRAVARHGARRARELGLLSRSGGVVMSGWYVERVLRRTRGASGTARGSSAR